jgi:hypothetical protein
MSLAPIAIWSNFFAAETGAAAALSGLIIVAISINLSRILADPLLPGRAAETLVQPAGVLVASTFALVPGQAGWLLGLELVLTGAVMCAMPTVIQISAFRRAPNYPYSWWWVRVVLAQAASLSFVAAGAMLVLGIGGALYWTVPGIIVALIGAVLNTWVLLIEILR